MNDQPVSDSEAGTKPVRTVGIGASAGGLEACKELFANLPDDTGMAFVVVLHLDPNHESHLAELFAKSTAMPVVEVSSEQQLLANHIYVIVPDTDLDLKDGMLYPRQREESSGVRRPINALFAALAHAQRERAVAVVLSGTGDDGTNGLREIDQAGGVCLVQEPESAGYDAMPRAAINTGIVDEVLRPQDMGEALARQVGVERDVVETGDRDVETGEQETAETSAMSDDSSQEASEGLEHRAAAGSDAFQEVLDIVSREYELDFDDYRRGTLSRRMSRRMAINHFSDTEGYLAFVRDNPDEVDVLYQDLLIDVTEFFRDAEVWEFLEDEIMPELLEAKDQSRPLRFWVPACSSGEEAYSLAIIILEALDAAKRDEGVQIFATDINQRALEIARRGLYSGKIANNLSDERLDRYFERHGDHLQIKARVRELVTFAPHDLLANPPFSRMDLVSCRNLLIYLQPNAQQRALELMRYALRPGGYLVLGTSESVARRSQEFDVVSQKLRIYKSQAMGSQEPRPVPRWLSDRSRGQDDAHQEPARPLRTPDTDVEGYLEQHILSRHAPAAVAVNEELDIRHFFGRTDDFLVAPTGAAQLDLLAWVRPGLYADLEPALQQVIESGESVEVGDLQVERDDKTRPVTCLVEPLTSIPGAEGLYLVTFRELAAESAPESAQRAGEERALVKKLETQLRTARRQQRQLAGRLEDTNEEYQAHHEELLSLNEELQSTNEELEMSKEELQSLNEEMITINQELEEKNRELRELNTDLNNLFVSTDIPTIFLDKKLRVRRFTPASTRVMRLVPSDIGRSIEHVKERFDNGHLLDAASTVIEGGEPVQTEVETDEGRYYVEQVMPYRTDQGEIDGVCITFTDITEQRERAADIDEARQYSEAIVRTIRTPLLVLDAELQVISANESFYQTFSTDEDSVIGERIFEADDHRWEIPGLRSLLEKILPERLEVDDYSIEHDFKGLGQRYLRLNARTMERPGNAALILLSIEDFTARREAELEAEQRAEELAEEHERKDEFLAMLGHELRNPLAALSYGLEYFEADEEDERGQKTRQVMERQLRRMQMMLDQLLEMSRVASGKIVLESEPVDLAQEAQYALDTVAPLIESHGHELTTSLPVEGEVVVIGDANRLAQVIENLLTNAIKYTDDGGQIWVTLEQDGEHAVFSVRDSGMGIEADLLPHVFELFTQASRTLQRSEGGLGLGLSLASELIEMHHGTLEARSEGLGEGSEFIVTLPLSKEKPVTPDEQPAPVVDEPKRVRRVLIVDDEADAAEMFGLILEANGHETRIAGDGRKALELARSFDPDVVLLDLGLPGMSGYDVARHLRKEGGDRLTIVALTGYQEDLEQLEAAGFDRHIIKPPDLDRLNELIVELG